MAEPASIETSAEDVKDTASDIASDATLRLGPLDAYEALASSEHLSEFVALATPILTDAARTRSADWANSSRVAAAASEAKLPRSDCETRFGNVLAVLSTGGEGAAERALAAALWAHVLAEAPRERAEDEDRLAVDLLWLATHTAFDATPLLDRALGDDADDMWSAIAVRVRRIDRGNGGALGRAEALVACAALASSTSKKAISLAKELAGTLKDPVLGQVLATGASRDDIRFEGELLTPARGPIATVVLAGTGLLFALHAVRLVARIAFSFKRSAHITLSTDGVRIKTRTQVLGRTLREREHVLPRSGLVRIAREVRYPRLAFYSGLLALAVGSYVGVRTLADGVRSASPSLLFVGSAALALGVAIDFVLGSHLASSKAACRLLFVPKKGSPFYVGGIDAGRADDALKRSFSQA